MLYFVSTMEWTFMIFVKILILLLAPFFGYWIFRSLSMQKEISIRLILSFSGAFLFSITVLHLLPEVFMGNIKYSGYWLLAGFFLQLLLDLISRGVEHGHVHFHKDDKKPYFILSIMLGLCIHAFLEGLPLGHGAHINHHEHLHTQTHESSIWSLLIGISLHKIPAAFALSTLCKASGLRNGKTLFYLLIFALMTPLAYLLSESGFGAYSGWQGPVLAVVAGSFLHISTTILLESGTKLHGLSLARLLSILTGAGTAILIFYLA